MFEEEHVLSTSFLNLTKVDRDPVVEALAFNAEFVKFLDESAISFARLLSGRILSTYSEWKRLRSQSGISKPQAVTDPAQKKAKTSVVDHVTESKAKCYFSQLTPISRLRSPSFKVYKNRIVVLIHFGSRDNIVGQTQEYLESNNVQTILIDAEYPSLNQLQGHLESALIEVDDIVGSIVFFCNGVPQIEEDPRGYGLALQDRLNRLLLICQSLVRKLKLVEDMPQRFLGAVTFESISNNNDVDPLSASVSSFWAVMKEAVKRGTVTKVIDFDIWKNFSPSLVMSDLLTNDRQGTIIIRDGHRLVHVLCPEEEVAPPESFVELDTGSVILAVGGGTGITSRCVESLIEKYGPLNIVLSGRTIPYLSHFWRELSQEIRSEAKDDLFKAALLKIKEYGTDFDLNQIHKDLDSFCRSVEILATMRRLEEAGGMVQYWPCDVGDPLSVRNLIDQCLHTYGKIDLLIYGAGVDVSQGFLSKDLQTFREVLYPKVVGGMNVLSLAAEAEEIKRVILFSSAYVWFGFEGSVDYVVGNRFLAAAGDYWNRKIKIQKISSIYWGPWADVGMVASDRLMEYFTSLGINMIPPKIGGKVFTEIISVKPRDVCVLDPLPNLQSVSDVVADSVEVFEANRRLNKDKSRFALLDRVTSYVPGSHMKTVKRFSLSNDRYLIDHVFDGLPIVPGVIGMELMAEAASLLIPELVVTDLRQVAFHAPIRCTEREGTLVEIEVNLVDGDEESKHVRATVRELIPRGQIGYHMKKDVSYEAEILLQRSRDIKKRTEDVRFEGLEIGIPSQKMIETLEAEGYHLGPIMTGQSEATIIGQGTSYSSFRLGESPALSYPLTLEFIICPFAMDIGLQCQMRRLLLQNRQMLLPYRVDSLKLYDAAHNGSTLIGRTRQLSITEDGKQARVSLELSTECGQILADLDGWCYITGKAKTDPLLLVSDVISQVGQSGVNSFFSIQSYRQNGSEALNSDGIPQQWLSARPDDLSDEKVGDFVAARRALWNLLVNPEVSSRLQIAAKKVRLLKAIGGAPYLTDKNKNKLNISISLAHSKGFGAAACSFEGSIGIDVETLGTFVPDWTGLSEAEQDLLDAVRKKTGYDKDILSTIVFSLVEAVYKCLASKGVSNGHAAVSRKRRYRLTDITPYGEAKFDTEIGKVDCQYLVIGDKVISLAQDEGQKEVIHTDQSS